ncbi:MAG: radical SAM family heme chaperone HemW [Planctomycetes bacterium]|nr:radical SAM family heme chaperone HemW [Planctomycetota bacterium]
MSGEDFQFDSGQMALYVHIPFCTSKCCYCSFYSEPIIDHDSKALVSALIKEMEKYADADFRTAYIGGGSPSCLASEQLLRLVEKITHRFPDIAEFTVEANPGQLTPDTLVQLLNAGVNRLSIGAQSFNTVELEFLGRRHTVDAINATVSTAKNIGFKNINLDLIFAVPGSNLDSWSKSLNAAIALGVQHISAYSLTFEQGTLLEKLLQLGEVEPLPEELDRQMYELAIDTLSANGFTQYEISNFSKSEFECLHNLTYWANHPYVGIGPAAGSFYDGHRTINMADIKKYIAAIQRDGDPVTQTEEPNEIEFACETAVLNLRRTQGIDMGEYEQLTGYDPLELFADTIDKYLKMKLLKIQSGKICLTRDALPIADSILCDFSVI